MLGRDVDLIVAAGEAHQHPFLPLTAIFAFPDLADQFVRQIVIGPVSGLGHDLDRVGRQAGFLAQFADRGFQRGFAGVDAALRHLPSLDAAVDA